MKNITKQKLGTGLLCHVVTMIVLFLVHFGAMAQSDGLPRGAYQMPYTRYEAEDGSWGSGAIHRASPTFNQAEIASEASNQEYVGLPTNGASIGWNISQPADGITLRFTMPDNESTGLGNNGSLDVYVNGAFRQTISLTSYYAYQYFFTGVDKCEQVKAGTDKTKMRFDEMHFKLSTPLVPGQELSFRKTNGDAFEYGIDFIEVETVPAVLGAPANSLSVTAFGANGSDTVDDLAAFHSCLASAASQGKNVYVPPGKYYLSAKLNFNVNNMIFQGAGVWHTELYFYTDLQFMGGIYARCSNVVISDFFLHTRNNDRWNYNEPFPQGSIGEYKTYKGFMGTYGSNSVIRNVWVEHFECGAWVAGYDAPLPVDITTNLMMTGMRIRNNYADGVNFCQGTNNSTVEHSSVRNSGDDALAVWPNNAVGVNTPGSNNTFRYNTIEHTWRAGGTALFGASGHKVHHNLYKDAFASSAIRLTTDFSGYKFDINTGIEIYENTMIRCGTSKDLWNGERGAIELNATGGSIQNITFTNNTIIESQRHAIQIGSGGGYSNVVFNNTNVNTTGLDPYTTSQFTIPLNGCAIMIYASNGTVVSNNLSLTNIENDPPIYKANQGFNFSNNTVGNISVTGVSLPNGPLALLVGQSMDLIPTFTPNNATNKVVTWSSSSPSIATVDPNTQRITALGTGSTVITVTTQDGGFTDQVTVNVTAAVNILATDATATETAGNTGTFNVSISSLTSTINVGYTISGSASSSDYSASPTLSGTISLSPSQLSRNIVITPADDAAFEGTETLTLTLQSGAGYQLGPNVSASMSITDNENPPCTSPAIGITSTPPTINTTIETVWSTVPSRGINNATIGSTPGDYSGSWKALYNASNLYVLVQVNDATRTNDSGASWWEDDVVEVFIDGNNSKGTTYDGANDFQLGFRWNDAVVKAGGNSVQNTTGITFNMYAAGAGYVLEASIPWSTIGVTPVIGNQIGFDISVDDDDNGGTRDSQMASFATTSAAWSNPSLFGSVYLTSCSGPVNQAPTANAGADQNLAAGITSATLTGTGSDPDGTAVTYAWSKVSGPTATITSPSSASTTITGLTNGSTYVFRLTVSDGSLSTTDDMQVVVANTNQAPTANAGADQTLAAGTTTANLSGSGTDPNGTAVTYSWSKVSGPAATITSPTSAATTVTGLSAGTFVFRLTVSDGSLTGTDDVQIVVNSVTNQPPTANAGVDQTLAAGTTSASLSGSGSDPNGTAVTFSWSKISGPAATITSPTSASTTVTGLANGSVYTFRLTVSDGSLTATDDVVVTVNSPGSSSSRGAYQMPYVRYEANSTSLGGGAVMLAASFDQKKVESEATDRTAARLSAVNSHVKWTTTAAGQGLVMRFSMPDGGGGAGNNGSLALYVGGSFVQDIPLTSRYSWQYFSPNPGDGTKHPSNTPTTGWTERMRFDEVRVRLANSIPQGTEIRIQKTSASGSFDYIVDFVELEPVPTAIPMPANYLNVVDFGATPNDQTDDQQAFDNALQAAISQNKEIYIPAGQFYIRRWWFDASNVIVQGAGMWYTDLYCYNGSSNNGGFEVRGSGNEFKDFHMGSANITRTDAYKGFVGLYTNSKIERVWVEHFEVGAWIANYQGGGTTNNLLITNCRFRNNYADGVNFAKGTSNSICEHSDMRNNGDDAMATWSADGDQASVNNEFRYCTAENTWRAGGIGFFGGGGHKGHHLIIKDGVENGIRVNSDFPVNHQFSTTLWMEISETTVIGCGTNANLWFNRYGAVDIFTRLYNVQNLRLQNVDIIGSQKDAIMIYDVASSFTITNLELINVTVNGAGADGNVNNYTSGTYDDYAGHGLLVLPSVIGSMTTSGVSFSGIPTANINNESAPSTGNGNFVINTTGNQAPTANAGADKNLVAGTTSTSLTGSGSDPENGTLTYAWTKVSGPSATIVSPSSATTTINGLANGSTYVFRLTVSDGQFTGSDDATVTVAAGNQAPTANAGADQSLPGGTTSASLTGSGTDPENGTLTYSWTKISGPAATITSPTAASTTVTGLANSSTYVFRLTVSDGSLTATDDVTISIATPQSPYPGSPWAIPGTIEVESYDIGGEGVAYHDNEAANQGGQYRTTEGVDVEVCSAGGFNVGWTGAGEWLEYTVNVTTAGTYNFEFRVASTLAGGTFHVEFNGVNKTGTVTSVNTGAWQTWQSVFANNISLSAGSQIMRIALDAPNHNLDKVIITSTSNVPVTGVSVSPTSASIAVGATQQLTKTITPANATNQNVTWSSSNTAVATVNSSGLVTAVAAGTATITVTTQSGGFTANSAITVTGGGGPTQYRIKNVWQNTYLYDAGDRVRYNATASGTTYQWILEDVGGGLRELKNVSTGEYMHIENLTGYVQCTPRTVGWMSSRWAVEDAGSGQVRLRNAWQSTQYQHVENLQSQVQYGTINTAWASAKWVLEPVSGSRLGEGEPVTSSNTLTIYPNPFTGDRVVVEFDGETDENSELRLYNLSGVLILTQKVETSRTEIFRGDLPSGIYLLQLQSVAGVETRRLIIK